jgi:hypothetical protein
LIRCSYFAPFSGLCPGEQFWIPTQIRIESHDWSHISKTSQGLILLRDASRLR